MTARERVMAVLKGERPDKIPIMAFDFLRAGSQGGWLRRLLKRGLGIIRFVPTYQPTYRDMNFFLEDVKYTQVQYLEDGIRKIRRFLETPVGTLTGVMRVNPIEGVPLSRGAQEEYFVKTPSDWRIMTYIFKGILGKLAPNYQAFEREEDELGDNGICYGIVEKTPFQRAWVDLASIERAILDFREKPEEFQEFIEIQKQLHTRQAEIAAESPATFIDILDNITSIVSPKYFQEYCMPYYGLYSKALEGTGKILGVHMDGLLRHLKKDISQAPLGVIESFTVPPVGNISLAEAKSSWPDKILFVNCPPHVNNGTSAETRDAYEAILEEWGEKRKLLIEHSEDIPLEKVELNLSIALDVFGY